VEGGRGGVEGTVWYGMVWDGYGWVWLSGLA
jgi:hypothetical protein